MFCNNIYIGTIISVVKSEDWFLLRWVLEDWDIVHSADPRYPFLSVYIFWNLIISSMMTKESLNFLYNCCLISIGFDLHFDICMCNFVYKHHMDSWSVFQWSKHLRVTNEIIIITIYIYIYICIHLSIKFYLQRFDFQQFPLRFNRQILFSHQTRESMSFILVVGKIGGLVLSKTTMFSVVSQNLFYLSMSQLSFVFCSLVREEPPTSKLPQYFINKILQNCFSISKI